LVRTFVATQSKQIPKEISTLPKVTRFFVI
jgi:hypothetical protein